jgi:rhodanese-related sulfurtransferase
MKSQDGLTNVDPEQLQSYISNDNVQLIDVRTPKEFLEGHINQAINIDYYSEDFFKEISKLNTKKPVYIYCRSGKRSGESVELFQKAGFTQVYNLDSGILGWISADLPVTSDN